MLLRRTAVIVTAALSLTIAACAGGGSGGGTATATPTPTGGSGGGDAGATPAIVESGAPASAATSDGSAGTSGAKRVPDDACSVITDTDIKGLFGGEVEPVENDDDEDNSCSFSVTKANGLLEGYGYAATTPQIVTVTFDDGYITYGEERAALGDAVDQVKGLGSEAWIGLGAIHIDLGDENELVVTTTFGAIYDPTVIEGERYALAKMVLSRL